MAFKRGALLLFAAIALPAQADTGRDKARAMMLAMHGDYCSSDVAVDPDWADKSWPLTWREEFQSADEPDKRGTLMRVFCMSGAYNVLHAWFMETEDGVAPLAFPMPAFDVSRETEEFDSAVTGIKVTGFRSANMLVNSAFDANRARIVMTSHWRGLGDAYSVGEWQVIEGEPVLKSFEVDASYDGEQTPATLYKAE